MISNQINIDNLHHEQNDKSFTQSPHHAHSTDTEPEVEMEIENSQRQENASETLKYDKEKEPSHKRKHKNGFTRLIEKIPNYEYELPKKPKSATSRGKATSTNDLIPFDPLDTDNNRFVSYLDAFLYIAEHCAKHHSKYTRDKCREYLKLCYIIDFAHDEFIPITTHLSKKEFNKYFLMSQRETKYF